MTGGGYLAISHFSDNGLAQAKQGATIYQRTATPVVARARDEVATLIAHIASSEYGRLYLDARNKEHTKVYQDVQMFCDFTIEETGQKGYGVLEIGKQLVGEGIVERAKRSASRV